MNINLERRLRTYVAKGSGIDTTLVIPGNESAPLPSGLFASVTLITDSTAGQASEHYFDADDGQVGVSVQATHFATYSVQFYRSGAQSAAERFVKWSQSPLGRLEADRNDAEIQGTFGGARFRVRNPLVVRDVSAIIPDDEYEERVAIDLDIAYLQPDVQAVGRMERVPVDLAGDSFQVDAES